MRIGVAGVGRIGAFHAQTLTTVDGVSSVVIADVDATRAQQLATKLDIESVSTTTELLAAGIDGLVIATPSSAHADQLRAAIAAGIPAFCEKPVAAGIDDTRAMCELVASAQVPVQVGFQRRFDAGHRAAREAVRSGALGWIHTIRSQTFDPAPPSAAYIASSGGIFRDCSVHDFDAIRWVTGRSVVEVYAVGANRGERFFVDAGDVDTATAMLLLDDDTTAVASATRYNAAGYDVRLELLGSADSVAVGVNDHLPLRPLDPGATPPAGPPYSYFMDRFEDAYAAELATFVSVASGRAPNPCTVDEALEAFLIAEACERSKAEHRPVRLDEVG